LAVGNYARLEIFDDGVNKRVRQHTSTDGVTFTQQNSTTNFQADDVDDSWYWGFYVASGVNAVTVTFDNIRVTSP
jgi:hypothetical protein